MLPVFWKTGNMPDLVATLLTQYQAGRAVTAELLRSAPPKSRSSCLLSPPISAEPVAPPGATWPPALPGDRSP